MFGQDESYYEFKYVGPYKTGTVMVQFADPGFAGDLVEEIRRFLLAVGFHPDTINDFVLKNPDEGYTGDYHNMNDIHDEED